MLRPSLNTHALLCLLALACTLSACSSLAVANRNGSAAELPENVYRVHYRFTPLPERDLVQVEMQLKHDGHIRSMSLRDDRERQTGFSSAHGKLKRYKSTIRWEPADGEDTLSYQVKVKRKRNKGGYDAYINADWAIFRGDSMVPTAKVRSRKGSLSHTTLEFVLPKGWTSVDTGWPKIDDLNFSIDNPERRFDRPTGWMIAGKLGSRRDFLQGTELSIAAPKGAEMQRMNALALINLVWPEIQRAFQSVPPKVLIVGAGDPMWRGGLSSPNSFYVHAERPLISENGTSTLLHELIHVVTRIRGSSQSDWIAEGLAEYYSIELMRRAGAMNEDRYQRVLASLARWSGGVSTLLGRSSSGATTARAVLLFDQLDQELRAASRGQYSIDDISRAMMAERKISNRMLRNTVEELLGGPSKTLATPLLK